jgi:hypothetical protein
MSSPESKILDMMVNATPAERRRIGRALIKLLAVAVRKLEQKQGEAS